MLCTFTAGSSSNNWNDSSNKSWSDSSGSSGSNGNETWNQQNWNSSSGSNWSSQNDSSWSNATSAQEPGNGTIQGNRTVWDNSTGTWINVTDIFNSTNSTNSTNRTGTSAIDLALRGGPPPTAMTPPITPLKRASGDTTTTTTTSGSSSRSRMLGVALGASLGGLLLIVIAALVITRHARKNGTPLWLARKPSSAGGTAGSAPDDSPSGGDAPRAACWALPWCCWAGKCTSGRAHPDGSHDDDDEGYNQLDKLPPIKIRQSEQHAGDVSGANSQADRDLGPRGGPSHPGKHAQAKNEQRSTSYRASHAATVDVDTASSMGRVGSAPGAAPRQDVEQGGGSPPPGAASTGIMQGRAQQRSPQQQPHSSSLTTVSAAAAAAAAAASGDLSSGSVGNNYVRLGRLLGQIRQESMRDRGEEEGAEQGRKYGSDSDASYDSGTSWSEAGTSMAGGTGRSTPAELLGRPDSRANSATRKQASIAIYVAPGESAGGAAADVAQQAALPPAASAASQESGHQVAPRAGSGSSVRSGASVTGQQGVSGRSEGIMFFKIPARPGADAGGAE